MCGLEVDASRGGGPQSLSTASSPSWRELAPRAPTAIFYLEHAISCLGRLSIDRLSYMVSRTVLG